MLERGPFGKVEAGASSNLTLKTIELVGIMFDESYLAERSIIQVANRSLSVFFDGCNCRPFVLGIATATRGSNVLDVHSCFFECVGKKLPRG